MYICVCVLKYNLYVYILMDVQLIDLCSLIKKFEWIRIKDNQPANELPLMCGRTAIQTLIINNHCHKTTFMAEK